MSQTVYELAKHNVTPAATAIPLGQVSDGYRNSAGRLWQPTRMAMPGDNLDRRCAAAPANGLIGRGR